MIEGFNVALIIFAIGYLIAYVVHLIKTKEGVIMTEELKKENETLEQGYVWDYMTQSMIVQKIVTKEKWVKSDDIVELKQKADNYYFKKYTRTLDIGEEERQKAITEAYIAGATEETKELQGKYDKLLNDYNILLKEYDELEEEAGQLRECY